MIVPQTMARCGQQRVQPLPVSCSFGPRMRFAFTLASIHKESCAFSILTLRYQSMSTPEIASREVKPTMLLLWHISALTHPSALRDNMAKDCSNLVLTNGRV